MSDHKKPMSPELRAALIRHRLPTDTPSMIADAFRWGWAAHAWLSDPKALEEAEKVAREIEQMLHPREKNK